jgi:uncharacterized SAM-binding protein YcdF (DUF218 family)
LIAIAQQMHLGRRPILDSIKTPLLNARQPLATRDPGTDLRYHQPASRSLERDSVWEVWVKSLDNLFPKRWRPRAGFLCLLLSAYAVWFFAINFLGSRSASGTADCILVPGARVDAKRQPGPSLKGRLDTAVALYGQGRASLIMCTGGRGESGPIEAEVAREYLVDQGVPKEAIRLEDMSHTTWENFVFASQQMAREGLRSCLVVTDPFHMQRCLWMAEEVGLKPLPAPSFTGPGWRHPGGMLYYTSREMAAWTKYAGERAGR